MHHLGHCWNIRAPKGGKRRMTLFLACVETYRNVLKHSRNHFTCRNMPTISAGSENGMIIMRCDSVRSGNSWPNRTLQNACTKLGQVHLLHWGLMLTRYENRFVVGSSLFWRLNQVHICIFSRWFRRCCDYGSGRIARIWRERYVSLSRWCNNKLHN